MAGPITWRNVDAANPALAGAALGAATQTTNGAFDIFSRLIQQRQAMDQGNATAVDEANKQAYLDTLNAAKTPEELAALQASGKLGDIRQNLTAAARGAVRGADEARTTAVRQGVVAENTFNDLLRTQAEEPAVLQAKALIQANPADPATRAFIDQANIKDKSGLYGLLNTENTRKTGEIRAAELHPFAVSAARRNEASGILQLTEAQRATDAATQSRTFDQLLAGSSADYMKYQKEVKDGITVGLATFAGAKNLPRNSDGSLADDQLTPEQKRELNSHLRSKGLPTLIQLGDDTAAANTFKEKLRQSGATPADIARLEPSIAQGFTSTPTAPIGREADKIARQIRGQQAEEALSADQYGSATNQGDRAKILDAALGVLSKKAAPGTWGYERYERALANYLDEGGIPIMDAKGNVLERVLPSADQMKLLMTKVNTGVVFNSGSDVKKVLDEWTENNRDKQGVKDFIRFRDRKLLLNVDPPGKR